MHHRPRHSAAILSSLIAATLATGCTTSIAAYRRPLSEPELIEINAAVAARPAEVTFAGSASPVQARDVTARGDVVEWLELRPDAAQEKRSAPPAALRKISVRNSARGAADGLLIGVLAAPAIGLVFGVLGYSFAPAEYCAPGSDSCGWGQLRTAVQTAALGAVLSVLVGPIIGGAIGHETAVDFVPPDAGGYRE
jgi:hypothetical protein